MLIIGWGKKSKKVADIGLMKCKNCHNIVGFELRELSKKVSLYFVPVAKWAKEYYMVCPVCDAGYKIEKEDKNKLIEETIGLPDNSTSLAIWNHIAESFENFSVKNQDVKASFKKTKKKLLKMGFNEDEISYVLGCFVREVSEFKE